MRYPMMAVLVALASSVAGRGAEVDWHDGKTVTEEFLRVETAKLPGPNGGQMLFKDRQAWVAHKDFEPLRAPKAGSAKSGAKPVPWLKKVNLLFDRGDAPFVLIGEGKIGSGSLEILGWVPKRHVIRETYSLLEGTSTVYRKASVINSREFVDKSKNFQPATFHFKPEADAKADGVMRVMSINFIWEETEPGDKTKGFYLLGESPALAFEDLAKPVLGNGAGILGWVEKSRVITWNTREGLMWDDQSTRKAPVKAYRTEADAKKAYEGSDVDTDTTEEPFEKNSAGKEAPRRWRVDQPRHPIITMEIDGKEVYEKTFGSNVLRRIAFVGNVINAKNETLITAEAQEALKRKAANMDTQIRKAPVEMLFVIDDTESMKEWFGNTTKAIDEVIKSVSADGRKLRVGFTFFKDVPTEDRHDEKKLRKAVIPGKLVDAGSGDYEGQKASLAKNRGEYSDDAAEQVFLGLNVGIEEAGWESKGESRKIVVLLGDTRDHADIATKAGEEKMAEVVGALCPPGTRPYEFYAYQVTGGGDVDQKLFLTQMDAIVARVNQKSKEMGYPARAEVIPGQINLAKAIQKYYDQAIRELDEYEKAVRDLKNGNISKDNLSGFDHPEVLEMVKSVLQEEIKRGGKVLTKDPRAFLEQLANSVQIYDARFVFEKATTGERQAKVQLFFNREELTEIEVVLSKVFAKRPVPSPRDIAKGLVAAMTGDESPDHKERIKALVRELKLEDPGKSDDELLQKVSGSSLLKIKYGIASESPLLKATKGSLEQGTETKDHLALAEEVMQKLTQMKHGILQNKEVVVNPDLSTKTVKDWKDDKLANRWFPLGKSSGRSDAGIEWIWLDFEKEWP
ncbi:vWA domain-containing protein [Zavarzinella formosa]|uniref:hypothetical protein n=1 Tax=Zavarzinella formosa TaxID=360055 RepID=UPI0002F201E9|nr:hypothetical protein [Zavarzinella formosa]